MFDYQNDYRLSSEITELSGLREEHFEGLYTASDSESIWQFMTDEGYGRANFEKYFQRALQNRANGKEYIFAVKDLRTNELAGMTRIYSLSTQMNNARIGHTWLGEKFQGTGLNKQMKYLLFEFLFDQLNIQRIGFGISEENVKSLRAMESVGCSKEGLLKAYLPAKSAAESRLDIVLYSLLKQDWESTVRESLQAKIHSTKQT